MIVDDFEAARSCDRCHVLKERCHRRATSIPCDRCTRLGLICASNRPVKRAGRRPRASPWPHRLNIHSAVVAPSEPDKFRELIMNILDVSRGAADSEFILVYRTITDDAFMEQFLLGPSFCNCHRATVYNPLLRSPELLRDAYIACVLSVPFPGEDPRDSLQHDRLDLCYRRASSALACLRNLRVQDTHDLAACLALGGTTVTFVYRFGGHDLLGICRQVLSLIKPIYESYLHTPKLSEIGFLSCIVMTEILECMIQTELPTLRFQPPGVNSAGYVDRYYGLCGTMLPYFYDLCHISYAMFYSGNLKGQELEELKSTLAIWRPAEPDGFRNNFTTSEVTNILCQAAVMQQAALLIMHRLQHPFGTEQSIALALANSIVMQIEVAALGCGRTPRYVDLALIVACLELPDGRDKLLHLQGSSGIASYSPKFLQRWQTIFSAIQAAQRLLEGPIYWYHLGAIVKVPTPTTLDPS